MPKAVFAIIVTYNRAALLRECLDAVLAQTYRPAAIIVINNASTDNTRDMLETDYADRVTRLHMEHNIGGGGGFHVGMEFGFQHGADWVWLMDDDGAPDRDSLECMMDHSDTYAVMNPFVVSRDDPSLLSFGLQLDGEVVMSVNTVLEHAAPAQVWPGQINPFNGTLVSRAAADTIGLPREEMFIWGDEVDYSYRLAKSGLPYATILNSIHRHPPDRNRRIKIPPFGSVDSKIKLRVGIAARNMGYIYRTHSSLKLRYFKPIIMVLYFLSQRDITAARDFLRYYIDGYFDRYQLAPSRESLQASCQKYVLCPMSAQVPCVAEVG